MGKLATMTRCHTDSDQPDHECSYLLSMAPTTSPVDANHSPVTHEQKWNTEHFIESNSRIQLLTT